MKIIDSNDFDSYWKKNTNKVDDPKTEKIVKKIITDVRAKGDEAVKKYASKFNKSSPANLEIPLSEAYLALDALRANELKLTEALELAADNIMRFSIKQREQFSNFECELDKGITAGQRVIPVQRAAIYIPAGRFPLISSCLMCMIPAVTSGVEEVFFTSSPMEDGKPDRKILAAAAIAANACGILINKENAHNRRLRLFAIGGAQAIAAFAFGTETVPRADVIAGPGSKYIITAKRLLYGQVGLDFLAGPSDVLIISDEEASEEAADYIAADMLAQAEHDPDARARSLVPDKRFADLVAAAIEKRLRSLKTAKTARASLDNGGLIIVYKDRDEAVRIANEIAPEHLELQSTDAESWITKLVNYGSLFIGSLSAEVLGDYSAGVNHTLPTESSARFTGGLSVRHFLKTVTTLRCSNGEGFEKARAAAEIIGRAEGLEGHALSAASRKSYE